MTPELLEVLRALDQDLSAIAAALLLLAVIAGVRVALLWKYGK